MSSRENRARAESSKSSSSKDKVGERIESAMERRWTGEEDGSFIDKHQRQSSTKNRVPQAISCRKFRPNKVLTNKESPQFIFQLNRVNS
jgi:hypothetical protein